MLYINKFGKRKILKPIAKTTKWGPRYIKHYKPPAIVAGGLTGRQIKDVMTQDFRIIEVDIRRKYNFTRTQWESFVEDMIDQGFARVINANVIQVIRKSEQSAHP